MFTGLIEATGRLVDRQQTTGGIRFRFESTLASELSAGDSVAVNGVCLTVVSADPRAIHADVGPETIRVTTLEGWTPGLIVNLERPLRADSRLGGHFVQGHVDAVGRIQALTPAADFQWVTGAFPHQLAAYL